MPCRCWGLRRAARTCMHVQWFKHAQVGVSAQSVHVHTFAWIAASKLQKCSIQLSEIPHRRPYLPSCHSSSQADLSPEVRALLPGPVPNHPLLVSPRCSLGCPCMLRRTLDTSACLRVHSSIFALLSRKPAPCTRAACTLVGFKSDLLEVPGVVAHASPLCDRPADLATGRAGAVALGVGVLRLPVLVRPLKALGQHVCAAGQEQEHQALIAAIIQHQ